MAFKLFKQDIDDLINEFAQDGSTNFVDMKKVWRSKKFSFIFEARPSTNQACFMQSLYAHSISYLASTTSLSHRLGGLYCLYCLYETQPFKPPFKIYFSLGELKRLKNLVIDAKEKNIKIVSTLVNWMLESNIFLFGFVDINEGSATERVNELTHIQNALIQAAHKKLFENSRIEHFIHMDMDMELDVDVLKKMSSDYAMAKELAIREASRLVDVDDIKHIADNKRLIGDLVEATAKEWNVQKELFYQQTGLRKRLAEVPPDQEDHVNFELNPCPAKEQQLKSGNLSLQEKDESTELEQDDENFGESLEKQLLSQPYWSDDENFK